MHYISKFLKLLLIQMHTWYYVQPNEFETGMGYFNYTLWFKT